MLTKTEGLDFLLQHGNLRVPVSRYGHDTKTCAPVAWAIAEIVSGETGEPTTKEDLDYAMGLVVNDHDDVEYLLRNYGEEYGFPPQDYLDE